jgi:hypothetical protein
VWFTFGLGFKLLRLAPRHERIVVRILGPEGAPLTRLIGVGEIIIGSWVASAIAPVPCAVVQTLLIATMNVLELRHARDLLLAPRLMLAGNTVLIAGAWLIALG